MHSFRGLSSYRRVSPYRPNRVDLLEILFHFFFFFFLVFIFIFNEFPFASILLPFCFYFACVCRSSSYSFMTLNLLSLNRSSTRLQSSSIELQIYCCRLIYSVAFCLHLSFIKLQIAVGFLAGLIETLWGSCCCCCCWNRLGMLMVVGSIWFLSIFGRREGRLNDTSTPKEWKIRMELFSV